MATSEKNAAGSSNANKMFQMEIFDKRLFKWDTWISRLERSFLIYGINESMKLTYLLHYIGIEAYDVLADEMGSKPDDSTYEIVCKKLKAHYKPETLEIVENYKFHMRRQEEGESVDDYLIGLRKLAKNCGFGDYLSKALRNQLVFGLRNKVAQNQCLRKKDLSLEVAVDIAKGTEASDVGEAVLGGRVKLEAEVNKIVFNKKKTEISKKFQPVKKANGKQKVECFRCLGEHYANECKFIKYICSKCKLKGHIRKACRNENSNVNSTNQIDDLSEPKYDYICTLDTVLETKNDEKIFQKLKVENKEVNFEVDTGSKNTVISKRLFDEINEKKI